jgi:galactokinase/mevalonate kinase-like predicted kinase
MKMFAGPEISFRTSYCDLKQKEQYRVFFGSAAPALAGTGSSSCLAGSVIATSLCQG